MGTKAGGIVTAQKNKQLYGADYYIRMGRLGGQASRKGGFWHKKYVLNDVESVKAAGARGGRLSVRRKKET